MQAGNNWYRRVEALYQEALDEPAEGRRAFVELHCGGDEALKRDVEELLRHYDSARDTFLEDPAHALPGTAQTATVPPERIGRYRILGVLGEGGMGVVYRAEQEHPKREVALKVIRPGVSGGEAVRRFALEASLLARLQHPGIAAIYEAGAHADGTAPRPFFVMELVDGEPLLHFVRDRGLDTRATLELMAAICDAVHHAHQKGVVHRDLKPSNILIVESHTASQADSPVGSARGDSVSTTRSQSAAPAFFPKILDFGVARVMDPDVQKTTMHTGVGQVLGTLPYMSPEQVAGDVQRVDTCADVYALGVLTYEALAGRAPFDVAGLTIAAAARIITEQEPAPLGTLRPACRGEISTIVAKAMEKDPSRRYSSASELAEDIRRHLRDEPIAARPPTTLYHLRKFARRNRGMVVAGAAAVAILISGVIVSTVLAVGQHRARLESDRQRRIAEAVNEFLNQDLLGSANPMRPDGQAITLRTVVDRASERIGDRFVEEPLVEAAIRTSLADTLKGLGDYGEAAEHAERVMRIFEAVPTQQDLGLIKAMNRLASLRRALGEEEEAELLYRRALEIARQELGDDYATTLSIMNNLALLLDDRGKSQEAVELLRIVLERRTQLLGEEHRFTMHALNNLARVYVSMERYDEAEPLHLKELELSRRVMGEEHPDTLISVNNLAVLYGKRGDVEKAEALVREALAARTRVLGPDHPHTMESQETLGAILIRAERLGEAEDILKPTLATCESQRGVDHPSTLRTRDRLIELYLLAGRLDDAEPLAETSLALRRVSQGDEHPRVGMVLRFLCEIAARRQETDRADELCRRSYAILKTTYGAGHSQTRMTAKLLCDVATTAARPDEAQNWCALAGADAASP